MTIISLASYHFHLLVFAQKSNKSEFEVKSNHPQLQQYFASKLPDEATNHPSETKPILDKEIGED